MRIAEYIFWACLFLIAYAYVFYPIVLFIAYALSQVRRDWQYLTGRRNNLNLFRRTRVTHPNV